jgi:Zn-dependent M28 family amino/carboxypeptidase
MAVDMDVQFYDDDLMAYNTIAEIPGTDLKREIVMLGGHLDSWQAGTGATDNGVGVAAAMEAVRIIKALKLQPRRTIRVALWTGEEQGLVGSRAYVSNHFGYFPGNTGARGGGGRGGTAGGDDSTRTDNTESPRARDSAGSSPESRRSLVRKREYDSLSVYFNLDHGAGKIRGVYLEGNEAARSVFSKWLQPVADLGANTITLSRSGGTDHVPFDAIGLPGFPFIQDPLDYWTRTHHSSADVLDRVPPSDLKQAATVLAVCTYSAAMADKKVPRKPLE